MKPYKRIPFFRRIVTRSVTKNRLRLGYNDKDYNRIINVRGLLKRDPKIDAMALSMKRLVNRRVSEPLIHDRQQPERRLSLNLPRQVNDNDEIIQFGRNLDDAVERGNLEIDQNPNIDVPPDNQNDNEAQNEEKDPNGIDAVDTLHQPIPSGSAALLPGGRFEHDNHMDIDIEEDALLQAEMVIGQETENDSPNDQNDPDGLNAVDILPQPITLGSTALLLGRSFEQDIQTNVHIEEGALSQAEMVMGQDSENNSSNDQMKTENQHDLQNNDLNGSDAVDFSIIRVDMVHHSNDDGSNKENHAKEEMASPARFNARGRRYSVDCEHSNKNRTDTVQKVNSSKKIRFSLPAPFNVRGRRPSDECRRMETISESWEINLSSDSSD